MPSDKEELPALVNDLDRFMARVEKLPGSCWLWGGGKRGKGYGSFSVGGRGVYAHRFAYEQFVGPIPVGLVIDHLCRVRHCVNPEHLRAVTNRENVLCGAGLPAQCIRKTHCPAGHEYTTANTGRRRDGSRQCLACKKKQHTRYMRKYRARARKIEADNV